MATFLQILIGSAVTFTVIVVLVAVSARAVLRWSLRRLRQAVPARLQVTGAGRPGLSAVGVRLRAHTPSQGRHVAVIRHELRQEVRGAERAVAAGVEANRPVAGLQQVMGRLAEQARALDVDLAVIGAEPDRRSRQQLLAEQHERLALLRRACGRVRRAVLLAGSISTTPLLRSIENDVNDEVIALALQARAYAELTRP